MATTGTNQKLMHIWRLLSQSVICYFYPRLITLKGYLLFCDFPLTFFMLAKDVVSLYSETTYLKNAVIKADCWKGMLQVFQCRATYPLHYTSRKPSELLLMHLKMDSLFTSTDASRISQCILTWRTSYRTSYFSF